MVAGEVLCLRDSFLLLYVGPLRSTAHSSPEKPLHPCSQCKCVTKENTFHTAFADSYVLLIHVPEVEVEGKVVHDRLW